MKKNKTFVPFLSIYLCDNLADPSQPSLSCHCESLFMQKWEKHTILQESFCTLFSFHPHHIQRRKKLFLFLERFHIATSRFCIPFASKEFFRLREERNYSIHSRSAPKALADSVCIKNIIIQCFALR